MKPAPLVAALLAAFTVDASATLQPGHLDPTFGVDGRQTIPADIATARDVNAVTTLVGPDERIYVVTTARTAEKVEAIAIMRLDANGAIDAGLGEQGVVVHLPEGVSKVVARGATFDDDGRLVVVGEAKVDNKDAMIACRFGSDVLIDVGFGRPATPGCYSLAVEDGVAHAVIVQHGTGRVIFAGSLASQGKSLALIAGLLSDGTSPDSTFGDGFGLKFFSSTSLDWLASQFFSISQDSEGGLVAAGEVGFADDELRSCLLYRMDLNGKVVQAFGHAGDGSQAFDFPQEGIKAATDAQLLDDGKVVFAGFSQMDASPSKPAVARLLQDGYADDSFGTNGTWSADLSDICDAHCDMRAHALTVLPGRDILISGTMRQGTDGDSAESLQGKGDFFVLRLLPDGTPDPTFRSADSNHDGLSIIPFDAYSEPPEDNAYSLAMQGDRLLVAGLARTDNDPNNDMPEFHAAIARIGNGDPLFSDGFE